MVAPAVAAALISAGGGIASAALPSILGGGAKGPGFRDRIRVSKELGIHPLAGIGAPAFYNSIDGGSAIGNIASEAARSAGEIGSALVRAKGQKADKAREAQIADLEIQLKQKEAEYLDAQILESTSRTVLNEANAKRHVAGPRTSLGSVGDTQAGGARKTSVEPLLDMPHYATVEGPGGTRSYMPNPDAAEAGLFEAVDYYLLHAPQWAVSALKQSLDKFVRQSKKQPSNRKPKGFKPR